MPRFFDFVSQGVIPAILLLFKDDLSIDVQQFKCHALDVAAVAGPIAPTPNAHSTEVSSCTSRNRRQCRT